MYSCRCRCQSVRHLRFGCFSEVISDTLICAVSFPFLFYFTLFLCVDNSLYLYFDFFIFSERCKYNIRIILYIIYIINSKIISCTVSCMYKYHLFISSTSPDSCKSFSSFRCSLTGPTPARSFRRGSTSTGPWPRCDDRPAPN